MRVCVCNMCAFTILWRLCARDVSVATVSHGRVQVIVSPAGPVSSLEWKVAPVGSAVPAVRSAWVYVVGVPLGPLVIGPLDPLVFMSVSVPGRFPAPLGLPVLPLRELVTAF